MITKPAIIKCNQANICDYVGLIALKKKVLIWTIPGII